MDLLQYPFDAALVLRKKRALKKQLLEKPGLIDKKIALVCGSTLGEFRNILELFLLNLGIRPTFWEGGYGLFYENVVFDDGALEAFAPDLLYIHTSNRNLRKWPDPAEGEQAARDALEIEAEHFETLWTHAARLGCPVIQNNFEPPLWRNFGSMDAWDPRGRVAHVNAMNERMAAHAVASPGFYIHDLHYLASLHGLDAWCDTAAWYAYKYLCAPEFIPDFCHSLAALIGSLFGRGKKGVVTDLDNTLWGGIIGETGPEGIELGDESPAGMAYAEVQSYLKMLSRRGVLLAVASKNEEAAAASGFGRSDAPLTKDDFVAFEANWGPKTQSIGKIAETLNILPESLVFLDDNPAERELVRRELPGVTAVDAAAPERTVAVLDRGGWFEATSLSADDVQRGDMYRQNARRQSAAGGFGDYEEYLRSLDMRAIITPISEGQVERVTQLANKTNQFNLTTRRYTTAEMDTRRRDPACLTLAGRLVDKFGDNGITSVIIGRQQGGDISLELWIMSCRVFKRHLEYAMFDALVAEAKHRGAKTITGVWLQTAKNLLVREFYATIGFDIVAKTEERWDFIYRIPDEYTPMNHVMEMGDADE